MTLELPNKGQPIVFPEDMTTIQRTWEALKLCPNSTGKDIASAIGIEHRVVAANLSSLEKGGKVRPTGKTPSLSKGRALTTYEVSVPEFKTKRPAPALNGHNGHAKPSPEPEVKAEATPVEATPKASKVFWTQEEIDAVVEQWAKEHVANPRPFDTKSLHYVAGLNGFGYRPRPKLSGSKLTTFVERHAGRALALAKEFKAKPELMTKPKDAAPGLTALADAHKRLAEAVMSAPPPPVKQPSPGELIEQALSAIVAKVLAEQLPAIATDLRSLLVGALQGLPGVRVPTPPRPKIEGEPEQPREDRPQVLIVNALPAQFESVKRAFPDLDLRLLQNRMPAEPDPDLVISLTKFMNHPLDRSLRRKYGPRYCPVNGAADSVKNAITARLAIPQRQQH